MRHFGDYRTREATSAAAWFSNAAGSGRPIPKKMIATSVRPRVNSEMSAVAGTDPTAPPSAGGVATLSGA